MAVSVGTLIVFLTIKARETHQITSSELAQELPREMIRSKPSQSPPLTASLEAIEPAAAPPEFMPKREKSDWEMDLGRWADPATDGRMIEAPFSDPFKVGTPAITESPVLPPRELVTDVPVPQSTPPIEPGENAVSQELIVTELAIDDARHEIDVPQTAEQDIAAVPTAPVSTYGASRGPSIALVIDDLGNNPGAVHRLMALAAKPTLAFLPYPQATPELAARAYALGFEIFLHMPMQPQGR